MCFLSEESQFFLYFFMKILLFRRLLNILISINQLINSQRGVCRCC